MLKSLVVRGTPSASSVSKTRPLVLGYGGEASLGLSQPHPEGGQDYKHITL